MKRPVLQFTGFALVTSLVLTGCTGSEEPVVTTTSDVSEAAAAAGVPAGVVDHRDQPWTPADGNTTLGSSDEEIPAADGIPQPLHVGTIDPIGVDDIVIVGDGGLEYNLQVVDPATGVATTKFAAGPGIWNPVFHPFVGETPEDPALLAAEVWRPRGSRGAAEFTISTYSGNLLEPTELLMPDYTRLHSRWGSNAVTDDGRYFVSWDDALYGIRVFDLVEGRESGALALLGCGPFTWTVGHDVYSVCENTQELLHLAIQDDGSVTEVGRSKVLPDDFVSNRYASFGADADTALLVGANGDVYVLDLSAGLPTTAITPIGNAGLDSGRFDDAFLNNTATSLAVSYTDSVIHPHSVDSGDTAQIVVSDPATFETFATLTLEDLGLVSVGGFGYSVDGTTLYVQGQAETGGGDGTEEELTLIGVDALTGAETSRVVVTGMVGGAGRILTPQVIG